MLSLSEFVTKFPSLQPYMASPAPLVAIYFSSSWCPDCAPVTPALNELFLKGQPQEDDKKVMDLVYVSSDKSQEQMDKYANPKWGVVPFANAEERAELKRFYGACAGSETAGLNMKPSERKSGLPTLIIVDSKTGNTLTRDGVDDIMGEDDSHDPKEALQKWLAML